MKERRRSSRVDENNDVTISVISAKKKLLHEEITNNSIKNISRSGAKLKTDILLPVDTLVDINFTLKTMKQKITAIGKVKWLSDIIENGCYEVGVEFVSIPVYSRQTLEEYVLWKIKRNKS